MTQLIGKEFFIIGPWDDGDISILYNRDLEIIGTPNFRTALVTEYTMISEVEYRISYVRSPQDPDAFVQGAVAQEKIQKEKNG
ncbi:hypothetical protein [Leptospira santarosai]|uniref:hypothetical protein n=1 Tax=Leptospira santarosai TaxID=28183 RepID=UPI000519B7B9|nr:hypothetical protein [Leptospira santarosai]